MTIQEAIELLFEYPPYWTVSILKFEVIPPKDPRQLELPFPTEEENDAKHDEREL